MASADTSIFSFKVGSFPLDTFRVLDFTGREALSECYSFTIRAVASDVELEFDQAAGYAAALIVRGAGTETTHYGLITSFTQVPENDGVKLNSTYEFILEPHLKIAGYMYQSRIFHNKTVLEIVEEVLGAYFAKEKDFKIDAKYEVVGQDYAKREFTVQYNESDLDFVQRLLEDEGIFYFFNHEGDRELLILSNKKDAFKPLPFFPKLPFRPETGLHKEAGEHVDSMMKSMKFVTGRTTVKDYNYRTPDTKVVGFFEMEGPGEYYHFGDHMKTTDEARRLAQLRTEMFACEREVYHATSVARDARPGYRFTLELADAEGLNGEYAITRVTHHGNFQEGDGQVDAIRRSVPHYSNSFQAIPAATQFRPRLTTPKPKAPGILTAKVDGQKGAYAYLDEEGRYRMKLFFDRSEDKDGKASKAIRLAQPYAGAGYGMHFPLHTDTEIAVGFVDGDLDRPIGLGAVPNPGKGTPVKAANKSQNMMKSHSGNSFTMEDKEGKTGVHISSSGGHGVSLDDSGGSKGISISTSGSNSIKLDDTETAISITSKAGHSIKIDDVGQTITISTAGGHTFVLNDAANTISIADGGGNTTLDMDGGGGNITLSASTDVTITAGGNITLEATGDLLLSGKNNLIDSSATTEITSGGAMGVTASAGLALGGLKTEVNSDTTLDVKGKIVTVEGEVSSKLAGALVDINATGICTVAGATIKLN
ncbi:MAG: type VI secretion system tip protein TssI/VgrG [Fibrobacteria bacterium]